MGVDCDWKIPIEGSLESYHLEEVHPGTFGAGPDESETDHDIRQSGTSFSTDKRDSSPLARLEERMIRFLTGDFNPTYRHVHAFPNLLATFTDSMSLVYQIRPLGLARSQMTLIGFTPRSKRRGFVGRAFERGLGRAAARMAQKVLSEDAEVFPKVQNGLKYSEGPRILGRCEERIHAFQSFWSDTLSSDSSGARDGSSGGCDSVTAPLRRSNSFTRWRRRHQQVIPNCVR